MPTATINGLPHYYDDVGNGEALVLLHGANGSAHAFEEHHAELSQRFRVIAPDMRSMGRSAHVESMPHDAWVQDLRALLDHLGIAQAHVYGISLGSRVAMRFAIEYPERVRSIILTAPHTYLIKELDSNMNRAGGDGANLPPAEQEEMRRRHGEDWTAAYRNYYNIRNKAELQTYYNLRVSNPLHDVVGEHSDHVTRIACPILVLQSDDIVTRGRGTFDHSIELKNEMPEQVRLAIVPSMAPGQGRASIPPALFRHHIIEFANSLEGVPAG